MKISFNKKELASVENRFKKIQASAEVVDKELAYTAKQAKDLARSSYFKYFKVAKKTSITSRRVKKNKKGSVYSVSAGNSENGKFFAYTEWGTRGLFKVSNLRDIKALLGNKEGKAYALQFKGKTDKQTNVPANPFFYKSVRKAVNNLMKRLPKKILKK